MVIIGGDMAVDVVYNGLVISITDPDYVARFDPLDATGDGGVRDGKVRPDDFGNDEAVFFARIADAFITVRDEADRQKQAEGIRDLFRLYGRIKRFSEAVRDWRMMSRTVEVSKDGFSRIRNATLPASHWEKIRPLFLRGGEYSPSKLVQLAKDLYSTYMKLALGDPTPPAQILQCGSDGDGVNAFNYNEEVVPPPLWRTLMDISGLYEKAADWLLRYDNIGCDDSCKVRDAVPLPRGRYIDARVASFNSASRNCGGCFTGETYLRLADGGLITFEEMARLGRDGKRLPEIASLDPETGEIVYQRPDAVIDHGYMVSTIMYLNIDSAGGEDVTLRVTAEHPLLVERLGSREWIRAGDLKEGDEIAGGVGGSFRFDSEETEATNGAAILYDISFADEPRNYLVSPDGRNWIVAHNKILQ